ncbi:DUF7010 family protein [Roseateles asaccharophilus]|uniref:FtsH-binding integral membrane protein n=1 Tax=Roseateles asaccharophilus TaxID=582607 RepID=A0ABU2A630_9BURK|nr:hypothetical protein [Roseateles asaccharophilus]MDR7332657.1 FtsH-binding integral membrane protein [Roseateles asaccharophilus]
MNQATLAADAPDLAQAQADMRAAYWHGAFGVLCSALAWGVAAAVAALGKPQQAVWTLLIAGMFIFPLSMGLAKLAGRAGMHEKTNPLGRLAMFSTFGLLAGCALALGVATQKLEWFFPTMLLVIGLRYLVFTRVYGLRIYQACGLALAAAGLLLGALLFAPSPELKPLGPLLGAATGAIIETLFGITLFVQGRTGR